MMKKEELFAFIITFILTVIAVFFLLWVLRTQTIGAVLPDYDYLPFSAQENVCEVGFHTCGVSNDNIFSLFGKYTLGRQHSFLLSLTQFDFGYDVYNDVSQKTGSVHKLYYSAVVGYRYQFWDIDKPFLAVGVKTKYLSNIQDYDLDLDLTVLETKTKTFFSPAVSLGIEDIRSLVRYFIVLQQEIKAPINISFGLKGSLLSVENVRSWQAGFFVVATLKEYRRFSDLGLRVSSDFANSGYLRTSVNIVLGLKDILPRADLKFETGYRYHEFLGDNGEFLIKLTRKRYTPEVEVLISELRDLERVVMRIKDFTLGQQMVEDARSLIQQGAYDQAREVIEKLRQYLKEW